MPYKKRAIEERLLSYVMTEPNSGCWLWIGAVDEDGYGRFTVRKGMTRGAHAVSYVLFVGDKPDGLCVMHKCDTPCCVNPAHLQLGTLADNVRDMDAKGRRRPCARITHCKHGHALEGYNVIIRKDGGRFCRACGQRRNIVFKSKRKDLSNVAPTKTGSDTLADAIGATDEGSEFSGADGDFYEGFDGKPAAIDWA